MISVSQQQIAQRFTDLSQTLREALFSGKNAEIIYYISKENQLSDEQINNLSVIAGDVILGFLDVRDTQEQIKKDLALDDIKSRTLARKLSDEIFSPIRKEIEQNFRPEIEEKTESTPIAAAPARTQPQSQSQAMPSAMPHMPIQKSFRDFIPRKPGETPVPVPAENIAKEVGPLKVESPVVNLQTFEIKHPAETPAEPSAPFMLHQENGQTAVFAESQKPVPKFSIKPELSIKVQDYYQAPAETKRMPTAVKIETPQNLTNDKQQTTNDKSDTTMRVVHYSGFRTPINSAGFAKKETADENTIDLRKFSR